MKITGSGESSLLLLKIIKRLDRLNIPYAVVGAFAGSYHGTVRASLDADALISPKVQENHLSRLTAALKKDGFKVILRQGDREDPIRSVIHVEDGFQNRVDLLTGIRGMGEDVFERIIKTTFRKQKIKIIGVEDFIAMKIFAGSPKDLMDATGALKVSASKIDRTLLRELTLRHGKDELRQLEKLLKEVDG